MNKSGPKYEHQTSFAGRAAWQLITALGIILISGSVISWLYFTTPALPPISTPYKIGPEYCDPKVSQLRPLMTPSVYQESEPPVVGTRNAPGPAPEGMVWIPSGEFSMEAMKKRSSTPDRSTVFGLRASGWTRPRLQTRNLRNL